MIEDKELKRGSRGSMVRVLQYLIGSKPDGIFGIDTERKLMIHSGLYTLPINKYFSMRHREEPKYVYYAKSFIGKIKEDDIDGDGSPDNRDPILDEMTKHVFSWFSPTDDDKGYPWCAIFISYILHLVYDYNFKDARVKMWRDHLRDNGRQIFSKLDFKKENIYIGLWLNDNGFGHIFFIDPLTSLELAENLFSTIEGNTNDGGSRDGDGVYRRIRDVKEMEMYELKI